VAGRSVLEERGVRVGADEPVARALGRLGWELPGEPRDDGAWLSAWLHTRGRAGRYLCGPYLEEHRLLSHVSSIGAAAGEEASRGKR
jgi:hypothetical protein